MGMGGRGMWPAYAGWHISGESGSICCPARLPYTGCGFAGAQGNGASRVAAALPFGCGGWASPLWADAGAKSHSAPPASLGKGLSGTDRDRPAA